jgi:hypothetical protein
MDDVRSTHHIATDYFATSRRISIGCRFHKKILGIQDMMEFTDFKYSSALHV